MTCTFCGSILEDNEVECPYCGHKTALARNNEPEPAEEYEEEYENRYAAEEEPIEEDSPEAAYGEKPAKAVSAKMGKLGAAALSKLPKLKTKGSSAESGKQPDRRNVSAPKTGSASRISFQGVNPAVLALIGFAACLLLSIICLITVAGLRKNLEQTNQNLLSQVYQLQNSNQKLSDRLDSLGSTVSTVSTVVAEQGTSSNITITKEPTSAATYLGRGGTQDSTQNVPVFSVSATGQNLSFAWQKYDDASSSWVNLVFDAESNNETYGLHVYTDIGKGYSELAAHGVTPAAYGTYRCLVSDSVGNKATDTVTLTERSNT